jgi:hypothetical protein
MLIEKDIKKILGQLAGKEHIQFAFDGFDILIRFLEDASKLSLKTTVYFGGNYIPTSVRHSVSHKSPTIAASIPTFFTIDENNFQIHLHYLGPADAISNTELKSLLEEFGSVAQKWRNQLDEHDRNDLVYVRVK